MALFRPTSSLVRIVRLVLDVRERGESTGTEAVEFVLEEHDFLLLLLDDVQHTALVGNGHDLLAWIASGVLVGRRLQVDNLLTLVDFHAQVTSLALQLSILTLLVFDLLKKFLLLGSVCLQPVGGVLLQLPDLVLEALLVVLILLLVLTLDDLLRLLGDAVELDVKGACGVIFDLQGLSLYDVLNLLQLGLVGKDLLHLLNLLLALLVDVVVLLIDDRLINKDGVLVVSGDRKLRNLNLTLLEEDDGLEVELEFLLAIASLLVPHLSVLEFLHKRLLLALKVVDEVTEVAKTILVLLLDRFHGETDVTLMGNLLELLRHDLREHVPITLEVVDLLLLLLFNQLVYSLEINLTVGIEKANVRLHLLLLLLRHLDLAL